MAAPFNNFTAICEMVFVLTLPCRGFILKPIERPYVSLKKGTSDF